MKNKAHVFLKGILDICVALSLPLVMILSVTFFFAYNPSFYKHEFERYELDAYVGIEMDDMNLVAHELIAYIKGQRLDLEDVNVQIAGTTRGFFNDREKAHMRDVVLLFQKIKGFRNVLGLVLLLALLVGWIQRSARLGLLKALVAGGFFCVLLSLWIIGLSLFDFTAYFTKFHELTFSNDLWLLDPETDLLIRMLPLEFFMDMVKQILLWTSMIGCLIAGTGIWMVKKSK